MKQHVQIMVQPRWYAWGQDFYVRCARREFGQWLWAEDNRRWASGLPGMQNPKHAHPSAIAWLEDRYIKGRGDYRIRMDFDQFFRAVTSNWSDAEGYFLIPYHGRTNKGPSYTKSPDHAPKPERDRAWEIETNHKRDKARHGRGDNHHGNRGRHFCAKQSARDHRAWVRRELNRENYDAFCKGADSQEYKQFVNPWDWD
jgi:hypothetical protein